jgi:hypothetical protein
MAARRLRSDFPLSPRRHRNRRQASAPRPLERRTARRERRRATGHRACRASAQTATRRDPPDHGAQPDQSSRVSRSSECGDSAAVSFHATTTSDANALVSACQRDRPDHHDWWVFQPARQHPQRRRLESPRRARPAGPAARRRPSRRNRRGIQRIGTTPLHWPFQLLQLRNQLQAVPIMRSRASFWSPIFWEMPCELIRINQRDLDDVDIDQWRTHPAAPGQFRGKRRHRPVTWAMCAFAQ